MNLIDFTKNGGYRFKQFTLRKMQEAYFQLLKAFITFCNVPEEGNYIISGCKVVGANITAGYLYIEGELCMFTQTAGDLNSKIKKNVVIQSLGFKNGNNENVFRFVNAIIDPAGTELSAFIRVSPVFDANYVHTDNNYTDSEKTKLEGIEAGAEVNVQPDWNVVSTVSDAFIKNKPIGLALILKQGSVIVGDVNDLNITADVDFGDVGLTAIDYNVIVEVESISSDINLVKNGAKMTHVIYEKTLTSFKVCFQETPGSGSQNIQFRYLILNKL